LKVFETMRENYKWLCDLLLMFSSCRDGRLPRPRNVSGKQTSRRGGQRAGHPPATDAWFFVTSCPLSLFFRRRRDTSRAATALRSG